MSKTTKEQRRKKRKAKELQQQKRRRAERGKRLAPWEAPKMEMFQLPQLLKDGVPLEKRLDLMRSIGKDAGEKFSVLYPHTIKWVTQYERSEEHTSELQSLMRISYAVFCLKKQNHNALLITLTTRTAN